MKIVVSLVWAVILTVVLYLGSCFVLGFCVGFEIGAKEKDPEVGRAKVQPAVEAALNRYLPFLVGGSVGVALLASFAGFLPGTRSAD
jgi:hypothetical protein